MADRCAIQPLDVSTFPTPDDVSNPGFTDLFNDLVGNAATDADGWETDIEEANALLDAIDGALSDLGGADGGTLDDTFEDVLAFDPADAGGHVVAATAAIADAQTDVDKLGNALAAASLPTPPQPSGGGGGHPAGGNVGAIYFPSLSILQPQFVASFDFVNPLGQDLTGITTHINEPNPAVFSIFHDLPSTIPRGGSALVQIKEILYTGPVSNGVLEIRNDQTSTPYTVTLIYGGVNRGGPGVP